MRWQCCPLPWSLGPRVCNCLQRRKISTSAIPYWLVLEQWAEVEAFCLEAEQAVHAEQRQVKTKRCPWMSLFLVTSGRAAPECLELPQLEEAHAAASVHFTSLLTVPSSYHQYVLHMHNSDHAGHRLVKAKEVSGNDRQPYTLAASRTYPALQNCSSPVSSPTLFTDPLMERPRAKRADLRHTFGLMQGSTQAINKAAGAYQHAPVSRTLLFAMPQCLTASLCYAICSDLCSYLWTYFLYSFSQAACQDHAGQPQACTLAVQLLPNKLLQAGFFCFGWMN